MKDVQDNAHKELITFWVEQNTRGLRNEQLVQLYGSAFGAIEASGLSLKGLLAQNENYKTEELRDGLSYLLAEFLTVIGNITSDVLSESLHKELMKVTSQNVLNRPELLRGVE